jgi:hypothetical protein
MHRRKSTRTMPLSRSDWEPDMVDMNIRMPVLHRARILPRRARRPVDVVVEGSVPVVVSGIGTADFDGEIRIIAKNSAYLTEVDGRVLDGRLYTKPHLYHSSQNVRDEVAWFGDSENIDPAAFGAIIDPTVRSSDVMTEAEFSDVDPTSIVWSGRAEAEVRASRLAGEILVVDGRIWSSLEEPVFHLGSPRSPLNMANVDEWWSEAGCMPVRLDRVVGVPDLARTFPVVRGDAHLVRWRFPDWRRNALASVAALASRPVVWNALGALGLAEAARGTADLIRNGSVEDAARAIAGWVPEMRWSFDRSFADPVVEGGMPHPADVVGNLGDPIKESLRLLSGACEQMALDGHPNPWVAADYLSDEVVYT